MSFIDNIFKPLDYKIICTEDLFFNNINPDFLVWSFIKEKLKKEKIKFYDNVHLTLTTNVNNKFFYITSCLYKSGFFVGLRGRGVSLEKIDSRKLFKIL
ncbi:hypothetical protein SKUN_00839 [Spiroplasma kunkelii CR2-3x]|uniref:Uncharacterized protein n=1 Tax=Spiroplasma kunkelii CR2-3x TaxID=273035 RepID=A0A0K2JGL5_SPIKU|nr:hypothetical protein SKUN_00839 [Spiroplasma kunkelii CR2-3x]